MDDVSQQDPREVSQHVPVQHCRACGYQGPDSRTSRRLVSSLKDISASSEKGCVTCSLLLQGIELCAGKQAILRVEYARIEINIFRSKSFDVQLRGAPEAISYFVSPAARRPEGSLQTLPIGYAIPDDTASDQSFEWVVQHLEECDASHEHCKVIPDAVLPKRVLDIGDSNNKIIRVFQTHGKSGHYACLSHCWGPHLFLRALTKNAGALETGILWDDLPLTFQEAISFTRMLRIRYLWIDSLCIIQDDDDDWRREGAKMASIFSNAYITIAAAHSPDAYGGLFSKLRPDFKIHELSLPSSSGHHEKGVFARRRIPHVHYYRFDILGSAPSDDFPLLQRGWVFQESALSPRVLYFGSEELSWECFEYTACQCSGISRTQHEEPQNSLARDVQWMLSPKRYYNAALLESLARKQGKEVVLRRWLKLVEEYSALDLSFERDVFPALSGLAKEYGRILQTTYCAGLWESFALPCLLWHVNTSDKSWETPLSHWRAPTWSWASGKGLVSFVPAMELANICKVVDIQCSPLGPDPTGELSSGHIVLQGLIIPSTLQYRAQTGETKPWNLFDLEILHGRIGDAHADYNSLLEGPRKISSGTEVAFFHVGQRVDSAACLLLVLKPCTRLWNSPYPTYERIGLIELFGQQAGQISVYGTLVEAAAKEAIITII